MKKKKMLLFALVAFIYSMNLNAQAVIKGDMNGDGKVTIKDVTEAVNTVLEHFPLHTIGYVCEPFKVDNNLITGTWYKNQSANVTFNEDGTTDFITDGKYEFRPIPGTLIIYDSSNVPAYFYHVYKATDNDLIFTNEVIKYPNHYTRQPHIQQVTNLELSSSSLTLNVNDAHELKATISPESAENKNIEWATSNQDVASVNSSGVIKAIGPGSCTITCTATDGSNIIQNCNVNVRKVYDDIFSFGNETLSTKLIVKKGQRLHFKWTTTMVKSATYYVPKFEISIRPYSGTRTTLVSKTTSSNKNQTFSGIQDYTFDKDGTYFLDLTVEHLGGGSSNLGIISEIEIQ